MGWDGGGGASLVSIARLICNEIRERDCEKYPFQRLVGLGEDRANTNNLWWSEGAAEGATERTAQNLCEQEGHMGFHISAS